MKQPPKFDYKKFSADFITEKFKVESANQIHLSVRDLAEEIGVSPSTISRLHYGTKMDIDSIISICHWMGKKIGDFVK